MRRTNQLNRLLSKNYVDGWDYPRLRTLAGLRRRGVSSNAINALLEEVGLVIGSGTTTFCYASSRNMFQKNIADLSIQVDMVWTVLLGDPS
ncbi:putative glutamine--tRNA ligase [Helianthus annuus]|nr:putative glutamine--tRNA ligase [Helianthus annuus]